jgi:ubiquinol-cytochrome c reductase cytochrome c1 subunit
VKNIKIVLVLILFVGFTYWGIEPYAHHVFNPAVKPADFEFSDLYAQRTIDTLDEAEQGAVKEIVETQGLSERTAIAKVERSRIKGLIAAGDLAAGTETFQVCASCHNVESAGIIFASDPSEAAASVDRDKLIAKSRLDLVGANGLLPPDLSNAASIYDEVFLLEAIRDYSAASWMASHTDRQNELIPNKVKELKDANGSLGDEQALSTAEELTQKSIASFNEKAMSNYIMKMPPNSWMDDAQLASVVAYLKTQAKPVSELTPKEITISACARCHSVSYDKVEMQADAQALKEYLGIDALPPDLSMIIRSKGEDYLRTFLNDPQKHLLGTSMPRVGLSEEAQDKVIAYLDQVGDPKKGERFGVGAFFVVYFLLLSVLAYMWKHNEFEEIGK